jgi:hypothetical protein
VNEYPGSRFLFRELANSQREGLAREVGFDIDRQHALARASEEEWHEDRFVDFERLSRCLLLRCCTKFGWQLSRIARRCRWHGRRLLAVERKHLQRDERICGSQYFKRPQSRHDRKCAPQTGAAPDATSHGDAVDTPAANSAAQRLGNTDNAFSTARRTKTKS